MISDPIPTIKKTIGYTDPENRGLVLLCLIGQGSDVRRVRHVQLRAMFRPYGKYKYLFRHKKGQSVASCARRCRCDAVGTV